MVLKGEFKINFITVARPPSRNAQEITGVMRLAFVSKVQVRGRVWASSL